MHHCPQNPILCDTRWIGGSYGIGRFAHETISRLSGVQSLPKGLAPHPFHSLELPWLSGAIAYYNPSVYFSPGYNPPLWSKAPVVFTIHDLILLHFPSAYSLKMQVYFNTVVRRAAQNASYVLTVSEYSRRDILCWAELPEERVVSVGCGIGPNFSPSGAVYDPGFPYVFYVGSRRPQKNLPRLLKALAIARLDPSIKLLISGKPSADLVAMAQQLGLHDRLVFAGAIADADLPAYYRGALAFVFPSLYEGFGLPPLEAMACGTPVLTSSVSSLPEVAGEAAVLVDPYEIEAIAEGLQQVVENQFLREQNRYRGFAQAQKFTWEKTATHVQDMLSKAASRDYIALK